MSCGKINKKTILKTKISFPQLNHLNYCTQIYLVPLVYQVLEENLMLMSLWMTSLDTHESYFEVQKNNNKFFKKF